METEEKKFVLGDVVLRLAGMSPAQLEQTRKLIDTIVLKDHVAVPDNTLPMKGG